MKRIAVIPGDGIGPEVVREAVRVLAVLKQAGLGIEWTEFDFGAERFLRDGTTLPPGQLDVFRRDYQAILFGAVGDPRIPDMRHGKEILLALRFELDLYVNLRPVKLLDERLCPLKGKSERDVNFVIVRENTEGAYVGMGGTFKQGTPDEVAVQEDVNTYKGVSRIIEYAFEYAKRHGIRRVTMADKSNVMVHGHGLWQRLYAATRAKHPEIESDHMFVDALVMQMVKAPERFGVIVTNNMFGDIITDLGAQLQGGMGIAASANIRPGGTGLFEPIHGSAPKYAGQDVASPIAAVAAVQLLLDDIGHPREAAAIERAITSCVRADKTTRDLGGSLGTRACGDALVAALEQELVRAR